MFDPDACDCISDVLLFVHVVILMCCFLVCCFQQHVRVMKILEITRSISDFDDIFSGLLELHRMPDLLNIFVRIVDFVVPDFIGLLPLLVHFIS